MSCSSDDSLGQYQELNELGSQTNYDLERKLKWLFRCYDFSIIDYEDLVLMEHKLELELNELRAEKVKFIQEQEENLKRMHHHIGAGIRFLLITYHDEKMQYMDVDLKDILASGFPTFSCVEGRVYQDIPNSPGVCRVGGALFMVGGCLQQTKLNKFGSWTYIVDRTKWLSSAPAPPIAGGSFTLTWTRCDTAMYSKRSHPIVVPLHDGRIFICWGTSEPKCWVEIYDPKKGEFDRRDWPDHSLNPNPLSCFLWADQLVMLYYNGVTIEEKVSKPSLLLYDVERNNWEIFAENLPASQLGVKRHLIYVGGNILFIIDHASYWFVYDLSSKKEVGKVDVSVKGEVKQALYLGNTDIRSTSWIFYIFLAYRLDIQCTKVEVVQGKGRGYSATVQFSCVFKTGDIDDLYIIVDEASHKRDAEEDRFKVASE